MANSDSSLVGQDNATGPKYVLFESKSRNSQRKCSERAPENVKNEFKRNHFHICLFLRFRRLILIMKVYQTVPMTFDDVIKFYRNRLVKDLNEQFYHVQWGTFTVVVLHPNTISIVMPR